MEFFKGIKKFERERYNILTKYIYEAYGLVISSEIALPELKRTDKKPEIFVKYGMVKNRLEIIEKSGVSFQTNKKEFILNLDNIAIFYVKEGKEIIINLHSGAEERDVRIFLLGSVFGALLHQRGRFVLHASTIVYNNYAVSFSGISGAGKSTITKAINKDGFNIISDDVSVVDFNTTNHPFILPGLNRIKLWQDAAEKLGEHFSEEKAIRKDINKYNLDIEIHDTAAELKFVFILEKHNKKTIEYQEIKIFDKIDELIKNTYRFNFLSDSEKQRHLKQCGTIAGNVKMYRLKRPKKEFTLEKQIEIVKGILDENG